MLIQDSLQSMAAAFKQQVVGRDRGPTMNMLQVLTANVHVCWLPVLC